VWFHNAVSNESEAGFAPHLNGKLHRLFWLLLLAFVALSGFRPMMDNVDIGWHVAQGRWMVEHGALYRHDVFNYPNLGHPVIDEYPLFQVVLYLFWCLGWWGPCLLTALAYVLMFGLLLTSAARLGLIDSALLALALGLSLLFLQVAFTLRPHMVTYLGVVATGVFLLERREAGSWMVFWPLALLQVAWVNSHSGYILEPALVGLFGAEMCVRHAIQDRRIPWTTLRTWAGALLLVVLACFVNPYGAARLYLPFYHEQLESIRAYVGEMEPLGPGAAGLYRNQTLLAVLVVAITVIRRRGGISYSFLLMALLFYSQALESRRHWAIFGLFIPLLVLSSGAFSKAATHPKKARICWNIAGHIAVLIPLAMAVIMRFHPTSGTSLSLLWREYDHGRNQISQEATLWMKTHGVQGRLFHRAEDGGWLQQAGYDRGKTFGDTGFGKYDQDFIHQIGLVGERLDLLPRYLQTYRPDCVVCANFSYQWPYYLRQNGWRMVFYSPNSSAWLRPETRPDLPTVTEAEVEQVFEQDIAAHGLPSDLLFHGRNLLALNSLGLEDFAFAKMNSLPADLHRAPWYWEAARILCFETPSFSAAHREALLLEAQQLHEDGLTADFRAHERAAAGDIDGALRILEAIPREHLNNSMAELLLKIYLDRQNPEALALARRTDCFDLRNGRHWQYLAEAEERAGHIPEASRAWKKAVFYYPDDAVLMEKASAFAEKFSDSDLKTSIKKSLSGLISK